MSEGFFSGFISIIGRPNVGKSTLLNQLVGTKVAITSEKSQTTRNRITGVLTKDNAQMIFIDTPGIHKPKTKLGEYMVGSAMASTRGVDLILYIVDASAEVGPGEYYNLNLLKNIPTKIFLIINKVDLVPKSKIAQLIHLYIEEFDFAEVIPLSALTGDNIDVLQRLIIDYLPEGPKYYPDDMVTDKPEWFIISEIIREKILEATRDEIPHSTAVQVETMEERENDLIYISATIFVERNSQKGIIVGKGGRKLKEIGIRARNEMEELLGTDIYLDLWVKLKKDWRDRHGILNQLGYSPKD